MFLLGSEGLYSLQFLLHNLFPPRSDGQRVPPRWRGRWLRRGAGRAAPASRFPAHVVGGGRATGTAKLPPSSQPPVRLSLQNLIATGQPSETSLGVGANGSPSLRAESCSQGARGCDGGVDSDIFALEKADGAVGEPVLRIAPGNPNLRLKLTDITGGMFPSV